MKKTVIVALLALLLTGLASQAKADSWSQLYIVDQATQSNLYDPTVFEDSRGHKWVQVYQQGSGDVNGSNTQMLLYEYDGQNWTDHTSTINNLMSGLTGPWGEWGGRILGHFPMYADQSGNVWAEPGSSYILKYDGSNWSIFNHKTVWEEVLGRSIPEFDWGGFYDLFGDNQGNVYTLALWNDENWNNFSTSISVLKRNTNGAWSRLIPAGGPIKTDDMYNTLLTGRFNNTTGDIWFFLEPTYGEEGRADGVYRWHAGTWMNYTTANGMASNSARDMMIDSKGNVWVTSPDGVSKFDGSTWSILNSSNSNLATNDIRQISEDSKGRIWFAASKEADTTGTAQQTSMSVYDSADNSWTYFTGRNGSDYMDNVWRVFHFGDEAWMPAHRWTDGFIVYNLNDTQTAIYGQTSGDVVSKAGFNPFKKKKKKVKTINNKSVTIYKITKVKKKKKYKTKKTLVYRTGITQWYKALNLDTGKYQVVSKAKGKKKHTNTINVTNGEPFRLDLRY